MKTTMIEENGTGKLTHIALVHESGTGKIHETGTGKIQENGTGKLARAVAALALVIGTTGAVGAAEVSNSGLLISKDNNTVRVAYHAVDGSAWMARGELVDGYLSAFLTPANTAIKPGLGALQAHIETNGTGNIEVAGTGNLRIAQQAGTAHQSTANNSEAPTEPEPPIETNGTGNARVHPAWNQSFGTIEIAEVGGRLEGELVLPSLHEQVFSLKLEEQEPGRPVVGYDWTREEN